MSDPSAYFGLGIEVRVDDGSGMVPIPGVMSITGPGKTRDTVDVTSHSSSGGYREYISGLRDGGELSFDMNWLFGDSAQDALEDSYDSNDVIAVEVAFPMAATDNLVSFDAFVTDMSWNGPTDAQVTRSVTLKITGAVSTTTDTP